MPGRQHQVTFKKTVDDLNTVARKAAKTDFPLRMRNGMAADLQHRRS